MTSLSIRNHLEQDHRKLGEILEHFQHLKSVDFRKAREAFKEFRFELHKHFTWEESVLFPLFELKTSFRFKGPTEIFREEHSRIMECIEKINRKIANKDLDSDLDEQQLVALLSHHKVKEENVLYRLIDKSADKSEIENLFQALEENPPESC